VRGEDLRVGPIDIYTNNRERSPSTVALWPRHEEAILPQADKIAFMEPDGKGGLRILGVLRWDAAVAMLGGQMERIVEYPACYRASGFPTEEQIALLSQEPV